MVAMGCIQLHTLYYSSGSPTNDENEQGVTPQKLAKQEGMKDAMKELKKLTSFQDKIARGAKPKGAAEPWAIQVRKLDRVNNSWSNEPVGPCGLMNKGNYIHTNEQIHTASPCGLMDKALVS